MIINVLTCTMNLNRNESMRPSFIATVARVTACSFTICATVIGIPDIVTHPLHSRNFYKLNDILNFLCNCFGCWPIFSLTVECLSYKTRLLIFLESFLPKMCLQLVLASRCHNPRTALVKCWLCTHRRTQTLMVYAVYRIKRHIFFFYYWSN